MKKTLSLVLLLTFVSAACLLAGSNFSINAGYSYASMDDMKAGFQAAKTAAIAASRTAQVGEFGTSVFGNVDLGIGLNDMLAIGPRVGVQYVLPVDVTITEPLNPLYDTKISYSALLVPIMGGLNINMKIPSTAFQVTLGAYAGYGLAFVTKTIDASTDYIPPYNVTYIDSVYQGGGIMYEATGAVELFLADFFTISLNLGYRVAKFNNLKAVQKVEIGGYTIIPPGQLLTDPTDTTRSADFSGFNGGAGVNFRF
jgi:hypothetical protein